MDKLQDYSERQTQIDTLLNQLKPLKKQQRKDAKEIREYMSANNLTELQAGNHRITREQKYRFSCSEKLIREEFDDADNFIEEHTKEVWKFQTKPV